MFEFEWVIVTTGWRWPKIWIFDERQQRGTEKIMYFRSNREYFFFSGSRGSWVVVVRELLCNPVAHSAAPPPLFEISFVEKEPRRFRHQALRSHLQELEAVAVYCQSQQKTDVCHLHHRDFEFPVSRGETNCHQLVSLEKHQTEDSSSLLGLLVKNPASPWLTHKTRSQPLSSIFSRSQQTMEEARNPFSGKKRKGLRFYLPRKKRALLSLTVAEQSYIAQFEELLLAFIGKMEAATACLEDIVSFVQNNELFYSVLLHTAEIVIKLEDEVEDNQYNALVCADLISELSDVDDATVNSAGYLVPQNKALRLDTFYLNDCHCEQHTKFKRGELISLLDHLQIPEWIHAGSYRYHREELAVFTLEHLMGGQSFFLQADSPNFGGSETRWSVGYWAFIHLLHERCYHLIAPTTAIQMWVPYFPYFADKVYDYILKSHPRRSRNGNVSDVHLDHPDLLRREDLNICFFLDAKASRICRTGSGPESQASPFRKPASWEIQATFWDAHHRMHALKMLGGQLPNGLWGFVFGPTSGQRPDDAMWKLGKLDEAIAEACLNVHGRLYAGYADAIFAGWSLCLRCRHVPVPGIDNPLTDFQKNENEIFKPARETIEQLIGRTVNLFPILDQWRHVKVLKNGENIIEEMHVIYFLVNCITCLREGNVCSSLRGFNCPPPTLEEYLGGMQTYKSAST
jgi:hypothetical protein